MRFKNWVEPYIQEFFFLPGSVHTRPQDVTNVGMGVGSKYISDEEAGVSKEKAKIADFGVDTQKEKEESERLKKLRRLKNFKNLQRRNYV